MNRRRGFLLGTLTAIASAAVKALPVKKNIPETMDDLHIVAAENAPIDGASTKPLEQYLRAQAAILRKLYEDLKSPAASKGAALIGTQDGQTVQHHLDLIAATFHIAKPATGNIETDTATILSAFNSEKRTLIPAGTYLCQPLSIQGKNIDVEFMTGARLVFQHQGNDSFYLASCSGNIRGNFLIEDNAETVSGIHCTLLARQCVDLHLASYTVHGGKDLPLALIDCDNCSVSNGIGLGTSEYRPFAWQLIGCKNTKLINPRLYQYRYGIMLIGPGYKSGTRTDLITKRPPMDTIGMGVIGGYVEDHTFHAFDMNGVVGAYFERCIAKDYTGTVGNATFQVKQSTNNTKESPDGTFVNRISDCTAINCVGGFATQKGTDVQIRGIQVINCKRYPVAINATKRFIIDGVSVRDWGQDLETWPLQNGDTVCALVNIWRGSNAGSIQNIRGSLTQTGNSGSGKLALANIAGDNVTIDDVSVTREKSVNSNLRFAIRIKGNNCQIGERFRCGGQIYDMNPVQDETNTTLYPLEFGINIDLATGNEAHFICNMPQRGLAIGTILTIPTTRITGNSSYSVGTDRHPATIIPPRSVPANAEFLAPATTVDVNATLSIRIHTPGVGRLQVSIRGIHLF